MPKRQRTIVGERVPEQVSQWDQREVRDQGGGERQRSALGEAGAVKDVPAAGRDRLPAPVIIRAPRAGELRGAAHRASSWVITAILLALVALFALRRLRRRRRRPRQFRLGTRRGSTGSTRVRASESCASSRASDEGNELTVYTSLIDSAEGRHRGVQAPHGIGVTVFRSEGEAIAQRVSEEAKAGRRGRRDRDRRRGDGRLERARRVRSYAPGAARRACRGSPQDGWTATRFQRFVVAWNTKLLKSGVQPRSLEELAEPRWRGKIALEASDSDWY